MLSLNNLKTNVKLITSFVLIALITSIVGAVGIYYLQQIDKKDTELYKNHTVPISQLAKVIESFQRTRVDVRDILLATSPSEIKLITDSVNNQADIIDKTSAEFQKLIISTEMQALYDDFIKDYKNFSAYRDQIISLAQAGNKTDAVAILNGTALAQAKLVEADIDAMLQLKEAQAKLLSDQNTL